MRLGLIAVLLVLAQPFAQAAQESYVYTSTNGPSCVDGSREHFNRRRCTGPADYVVEYTDEGNIAGVAIWRPSARRTPSRAISWRGAGRVFGGKLEWRLKDGRPYAAILRTWRLAIDDTAHEELMIFKIDPSGACRIASINGRQSRANEIAQQAADIASTTPCMEGV